MTATCGHRRRTYPDWDGLCWTCHDRKRRGLTYGEALIEQEKAERERNAASLLALADEPFAEGWLDRQIKRSTDTLDALPEGLRRSMGLTVQPGWESRQATCCLTRDHWRSQP